MPGPLGKLIAVLGLDSREFDTGLGRAQKSITGFGRGADLAMGLAAGAVAGGLLSTIDAAREWESAFAGVKKTVDTTGMSVEQETATFAKLETGIRDLAKTIPITTTELAGLAEAGGALGIATNDLVEFARVTAIIGTTTDVVAQDAATSLGQIGTVIGLTVEDYDNFGAALVDLGNKGASFESMILEVSNRISGTSKLIGFSAQEMLGWSAAMANVGIQPEAAGGSFQTFAKVIQSAAILGTNKLDTIAKAAGMTNEAFQELWGKSSSDALVAFLSGLSELSEKEQMLIKGELGLKGTRVSDLISKLTGNVDNLTGSLGISDTAWEQNTAMMVEAEQRFSTLDSGMQLFWNRVNDVAITLGRTFMPMLRSVVEHGGGLVTMLGDLLKAFPSVTNVVTPLVTALSGLMALKFGARFLGSMIPGGGMFAEALTSSLGAPVSGVAKKLGLSFGKVFGLAAAGAIGIILVDELGKQIDQTLDLIGKVGKTTTALPGALSKAELQAQLAVTEAQIAGFGNELDQSLGQFASDLGSFITNRPHVERGDVKKELEAQRLVILGELDKIDKGVRSAAANPALHQALMEIWNPLAKMDAQAGIGQIEKFLQGGVDVISGFVTGIGGTAGEVGGAFDDLAKEIRQGFGGVKAALAGGTGIIDPETRLKNMRSRLQQAVANLREAIAVGDPLGIDKWTAGVVRAQQVLDGFGGQTAKTQRQVVSLLGQMGVDVSTIWGGIKRDTKKKSDDAADSAIAAARRTARQVARAFQGIAPKADNWGANVVRAFAAGLASKQAISAIEAGVTNVMASVQDFMRTGSPTKKGPGSKDGGPEGWGEKWGKLFGSGLAKGKPGDSLGQAMRPRALAAVNVPVGVGGGSNVTNIYIQGHYFDSDANYRKLSGRIERAERQTRRERRHTRLAEG